jgi:hypothetical protein
MDDFQGRFYVQVHRASSRLTVILALALFTISANGQTTTTRPANSDKETVAAQGSRPVNQENKVIVEAAKRGDLESEVAAVKAENAAFRESLRKMEEQQKALLELVERLQRGIDGLTTANSSRADQPASTSPAVDPSAPPTIADTTAPSTQPADDTVSPPAAAVPQASPEEDRYRDGILIWQTKDDSSIPFQLRFTNITQFRYLNTLGVNDTFTDHLGNVRTVAKRNDLGVNRSMFTFSGYIFDKRLKYNLLTWTSATTNQIVVAGNIAWQFNKAFTLTAGYWSVPGTRSLVFTFPYFTQPERSLADNFFRPGFTQGIWATGEPVKGLFYEAFLGNGLNTLTIPTSRIDTHLVYSGSVWWENAPWGPEGKSRNMYDDYFHSRKPLLRFGTSFTRSREDRFSNLDQSNPENTSIHNSDGVLAFSTGAFAPGVTLEEATYAMWAIDGGVKWRGLAINGQYYFRWLNDFEADGPLPVSSTFDHGGELSASYFISPKKLMVYGRTSAIAGQFGNSYEYAGGVKWYFVPNQRVWLQGEIMRVEKSAYGSLITPYSGGMTGWVPVLQTIFSF